MLEDSYGTRTGSAEDEQWHTQAAPVSLVTMLVPLGRMTAELNRKLVLIGLVLEIWIEQCCIVQKCWDELSLANN